MLHSSSSRLFNVVNRFQFPRSQFLSASTTPVRHVTIKVSETRSAPTSGAASDNFAVLLFGFAGSSFKQLDRHSELYNDLGYKTLSCILPLEHLFHNDTKAMSEFSRCVLAKVAEEGIKSAATVAFSNNGAAVYQHLVTHITDQPHLHHLNITGAVFDSGPGYCQLFYNPKRNYKTSSLGLRLFLTMSYPIVNATNGVSLLGNLALLAKQVIGFRYDPAVSWCGDWVKHEDPGPWPALFIYSEGDKLIPAQWLDTVVGKNMERRRVEFWRIEDTEHVAHLKKYPDLYREKVQQFLISCHQGLSHKESDR